MPPLDNSKDTLSTDAHHHIWNVSITVFIPHVESPVS